MNKRLKKIIVSLIVLFILMVAFIFNISGIFGFIEQKTVSLRLALNTTSSISPDIVRLYVDTIPDDDKENYIEGFSRNDLRKLIESLEKWSPKLLLLNVDLNSYEDATLNSVSSDVKLAKTLKEYDNIILSTHLTKEVQSDNNYSLSNLLLSKAMADVDADRWFTKSDVTYYGNDKFPILFAEGEYVTSSNIFVTDNKVVEAKPLYRMVQQDKDYYIPSMAFYTFLRVKGLDKNKIVIKNKKLLVGDSRFALNNSGNIFLNFILKTPKHLMSI